MPIGRRHASILLCTIFTVSAWGAGLQPAGKFSIPAATIALTPPMGWNPWNAFRTEVTEAKILGVATKLKDSGLTDAGYRYINIDDGWWLKRRSDGRIEIRTAMFPSAAMPDGGTSFAPFVDKLHGMGLKAGLYTDIGRNACSQFWDQNSPNLPAGTQREREIGSMDFQAQDMRLFFGEWKFDFVKVDACGLADFTSDKSLVQSGRYRALGPYIVRDKPEQSDDAKVQSLYASLRAMINEVRPRGDAVLSICTWGTGSAADWAGRYGQLWRTSADIHQSWKSMLSNFDSAEARAMYSGPGRWNDPDMLQLGNGDFDANHLTEARTHMSMWAIISAPLILGYDLTRSSKSLIEIAGNREVIAINQDPSGHQGVTVLRDGDAQVLVKTLAEPGAKAIAFINRGNHPLSISVPLARLNLRNTGNGSIRDVWSKQTHRLVGDAITATLAPRGGALLTVSGVEQLKDGIYLNEIPARINVAEDGRTRIAASLPRDWIAARAGAAPSGEPLRIAGKQYDNGIGILSNSRLEVKLDRQYGRFSATAGALAGLAPVRYSVYGDGRLLLQRSGTTPTEFNVSVQGVQTLELIAENVVQGTSHMAVAWADALLLKGSDQ